MIRGINRQDIFEAPEDYRKFIETLASLREVVSDDMQTKICTSRRWSPRLLPHAEKLGEAIVMATIIMRCL